MPNIALATAALKARESPTSEEIVALTLYEKRQARLAHPSGRADKQGRWWPSDTEQQICCSVRSPSRSYPWSLMLHCRTLRHVARLTNVPEARLRRLLGVLDNASKS